MKNSRAFFMIGAGQSVSVLGSSLTWFAMGVWLYQQTGSASQFALVALCSALPQMLVSPFAGVLIDRYPRRQMMALADLGAALATLLLASLFLAGRIQVWHIYLATALGAACGALQAPAYRALVASIVEQEQLGRANGLIQFGQGIAEISAPALAGVLVVTIQVPGVLLVDLATFGIAVLALLAAPVSEKQMTPNPASWPAEHRWVGELKAGWSALRSQAELWNFMRYQALFTFLWSLFGVLVVPMILGFSDPAGLGMVITLAGFGMLAGSLVLSAWGGP